MSTADSGRPRVGVIGLGAMGAGMAASLRRAGFALCVHDVRAEVAQGSDVVVSVVVNAQQKEDVMFGEKGAAAAMAAGSELVK